jgi:aryl-alcohol dehydrogenase-like predicted oxidoreductase
VSADTLARAHAVHPIAALQTEYSPWTREAEIAVLAKSRELGVAFVAFSPLARGFLAGSVTDAGKLLAGDLRLSMPRFQGKAFEANLDLLEGFRTIASYAGLTPAQLALAWGLAKQPHLVSIPGTTSVEHLEENFAARDVVLAPDVVALTDLLVNQNSVSGERYSAAAQADVDTERFASS